MMVVVDVVPIDPTPRISFKSLEGFGPISWISSVSKRSRKIWSLLLFELGFELTKLFPTLVFEPESASSFMYTPVSVGPNGPPPTRPPPPVSRFRNLSSLLLFDGDGVNNDGDDVVVVFVKDDDDVPKSKSPPPPLLLDVEIIPPPGPGPLLIDPKPSTVVVG